MTTKTRFGGWKGRSFQLAGVKKMVSQACAGLLWKPGLGKTSTVYMAFRVLQDAGYVKRMLVIAPIRPMGIVWPHQKDDFDEFQHFRVAVLHGKNKEAELARDDADIYVVNPEGLKWLLGVKYEIKEVKDRVTGELKKKKEMVLDKTRLALVAKKFQMLVVDESSKFRSYATERFKILKELVPKFKRRYILTGSPRPKSLMDLFGQVYILDEGASLGRFITHYRNAYFHAEGFGGYDWVPYPESENKILAKIAPLCSVEFAAGNIDLPELVITDVWVDLPPDVMTQYKQMEHELMLRVESGQVVAANAAVASGKCRQIANGAIYHPENPGEYTPLHEEKLNALEDLLEELNGDPALVTYEFKFDRAEIEERLKIPCISSGKTSHDNKFIRLFADGALPAVMGSPQSISLGIDGLQNACNTIIMVGCPWSLLDYEQVIDRVRRQGNKAQRVFLYRILARGTLDERVLQVLDGRDKDQNSFMKLLKTLSTE